MSLCKFNTRLEGLEDRRSNSTLISREQGISTTLGKTILITNDRTLYDFDITTDVLDELLDDRNLLPILLTEISTSRTNDIEQTANYLAYTIEMSRTLSALHDGRNRWKLKMALIRNWIHFLNRWSKYIISATSLKKLAVSIECTRIAIQVTLIIKLSRIQEN